VKRTLNLRHSKFSGTHTLTYHRTKLEINEEVALEFYLASRIAFLLAVHDLLLCMSWGYYGENCNQRCPRPCPSGSCHRQFGFCQCAAGLFGPSCRLACPAGLWGSNCVKPCRCHQQSSTGCDARVTLALILIH